MMEANSNAKVAATQYPSASMAASNERPSVARANTATAPTAITAPVSAINHGQERTRPERVIISGQEMVGGEFLARPEVSAGGRRSGVRLLFVLLAVVSQATHCQVL
jgi:hypothetical protein